MAKEACADGKRGLCIGCSNELSTYARITRTEAVTVLLVRTAARQPAHVILAGSYTCEHTQGHTNVVRHGIVLQYKAINMAKEACADGKRGLCIGLTELQYMRADVILAGSCTCRNTDTCEGRPFSSHTPSTP